MSTQIEVLSRPLVHNRAYHALGLALMAINQWRHRVLGYRNPRPRGPRNPREALQYDQAVVRNWLEHLRQYELDHPGSGNPEGRDVLEIGPGPDLGTGLILLAEGASSYAAVDAHPLLSQKRERQHRRIAALLARERGLSGRERDELIDLAAGAGQEGSRLSYHHLPDFDLTSLEPNSVDLIVAHSSFEHIADVDRSLGEMARCARSNAVLVAEIDLQTHTRWIRDHDPLNIYRYRQQLYRSLSFNGSPNRVRPDQYLESLERHEWRNPRFFPRRVLDRDYVRAVEPSLNRHFRGDVEQLCWMSVVLCARRAKRSRFAGEAS